MLKALIVDDEGPARKRLKKLLAPLEEDGRLKVSAEAGDGVEALEILATNHIDVLFLDVQMPELSGFDVLERVAEDDRPVVVFTTAYDEYAVKAFEANAVDYLLKPIDKNRLGQAVARAERLVKTPAERTVNDARFEHLLDWLEKEEDSSRPAESSGETIRQLSVPFRDRILVIPVERIFAAEVQDGITRLIVLDEKPGLPAKTSSYMVSYTLEQLESRLDPEQFMRVHRSAIVQLDRIREMISWFSGRYKLVLEGGHEIIASRERSKVLRARMSL
jgi:two-component system LytT family response regulator